jgi:hypothetical protein
LSVRIDQNALYAIVSQSAGLLEGRDWRLTRGGDQPMLSFSGDDKDHGVPPFLVKAIVSYSIRSSE